VSVAAVFNGGKMDHIFDFTKLSGSKDLVYGPNFASPQAQEALENANNVYWKIDGACGLLKLIDNDDSDENSVLELYERQDTRGKDPPPDLVPLPMKCMHDVFTPGLNNIENSNEQKNMICKNTNVYADSKDRRHTYYMKKVQLEDNDGKGQRKIKRSLLQVLDDNHDKLIDAIKKYGTDDGYLSVELIGNKFQKTPGVDNDVAIAIHCEQRIEFAVERENVDKNIDKLTSEVKDFNNRMVIFPRSFNGLKDLLSSKNVEGIILEHNEIFWKIRSNLMNRGCLFETDRSNAIPPIKYYTTTQKKLPTVEQ
jgi:hypothetical protein